MRFSDPVKISFRNLLGSKLRSILTILGVIIGVASVIVVMAIGSSAQDLILEQVKEVGSNLIGISPGASDEKGPPALALGIIDTTLKYDDLQAILRKDNVPNLVAAAGYISGAATIKHRDNSFEATFQGVTASLVDIENVEVDQGRFFFEEEDTDLARVVVLGHQRAKDLFPNEDPIGKKVTLRDMSFTVVGVLRERGSSTFSNTDALIYVPLFTAQKLLLGVDHLSFIRGKVDNVENIGRTKEDIKETLRDQHDIDNPKDDNFSVRDTAQALSMLTTITNVLKYFLASIAAISLVVGGVGIMNIMLISVTQRIREIGLRKAVGAKNKDVVTQFIIESTSIACIGGIIGIILGITLAFLAAVIIQSLGYEWRFIVTWQSIALGVSVSVLIGVLFGTYPAKRAADISPMEALRYE